eukprot:g4993.t1
MKLLKRIYKLVFLSCKTQNFSDINAMIMLLASNVLERQKGWISERATDCYLYKRTPSQIKCLMQRNRQISKQAYLDNSLNHLSNTEKEQR